MKRDKLYGRMLLNANMVSTTLVAAMLAPVFMKLVCGEHRSFIANIRGEYVCKVGDGTRTKLWEVVWNEFIPLKESLPGLFII